MRVIKRPGPAIPVRPYIVRLLGRDFIAAIYFEQMYFYDGREPKDAEGYFDKSVATIEHDTALTRRHQDRAREKLVRLGWIDVRQSFTGGKIKLLQEVL